MRAHNLLKSALRCLQYYLYKRFDHEGYDWMNLLVDPAMAS